MQRRCFLKKIIKTQQAMIISYRIGKTSLPEWVFSTLEEAKNKGIV